MTTANYIKEKLSQLELLLYFMNFCKLSSQKSEIESEINQIRFLINNADAVELTEATIESRMNYNIYRKDIDAYTGSGPKRPGKKLETLCKQKNNHL